jgi:hypothetical protein
MKNIDRLCAALERPYPERNLREAASELMSEGCSKQDIQAMLEQILVEVRRQGCDGANEDVILDFLDCFAGWCHPTATFLAEEQHQ